MFEGVENAIEGAAAANYQLEWTEVHAKLRELAHRRVELEAEEGTYLLEAEDLHVFKRLGYRSMVEYMVGELDYTRHAANERLRVTRELLALPKLAAAYRSGELCFSKVRELSRVVTPETEAAFLVEARGRDSHQIAKLVSGLKRGDLPDAPPDPALVTRRMVFELHAEALALLSARTKELKAALQREPTHDELIIHLCGTDVPSAGELDGLGNRATRTAHRRDHVRGSTGARENTVGDATESPTGDRAANDRADADGAEDRSYRNLAEAALGPTRDRTARVTAQAFDRDYRGVRSDGLAEAALGPTGDCAAEAAIEPARVAKTSKARAAIPRPSTQQLMLTCKHCDRSELVVDGEALAIDEATADRLLCDAELVGDAESDDRGRVASKIPAALRRKVFIRDRFRCVVPGCTARRHLNIHHLEHLEHGGEHTIGNLCVLCFHHHKQHHEGALDITGTAPHRLEFRWRCDDADDEDRGPTWDAPN